MDPTSCLIIGGGHFGSRAVDTLLKKYPRSKIVVVDRHKKEFKNISQLPVETKMGDGITYLKQFLSESGNVDYIIPAVPFHFAFEFILSQLKPLGAKRGEVAPLLGLPNPMKGKSGDLYTSIADFLCPGDCSEPLYCSVTGEKRSKPLFRILIDLSGPFESKVIHSIQLGPGVGGFRLERLLNLTEEIKKRRKPDHLVLISTACRCHSVTSALSL